jgi:hypothetical protein
MQQLSTRKISYPLMKETLKRLPKTNLRMPAYRCDIAENNTP